MTEKISNSGSNLALSRGRENGYLSTWFGWKSLAKVLLLVWDCNYM